MAELEEGVDHHTEIRHNESLGTDRHPCADDRALAELAQDPVAERGLQPFPIMGLGPDRLPSVFQKALKFVEFDLERVPLEEDISDVCQHHVGVCTAVLRKVTVVAEETTDVADRQQGGERRRCTGGIVGHSTDRPDYAGVQRMKPFQPRVIWVQQTPTDLHLKPSRPHHVDARRHDRIYGAAVQIGDEQEHVPVVTRSPQRHDERPDLLP